MATFQGQKIPACYASCSIGYKKDHSFPEKLKAIAKAGFSAIELSMPDILTYGQALKGKKIEPDAYATLEEIGGKIKELCDQNGLKILILQPFANFEGWPEGQKRKDAFERALGWMGIMQAVGTDMLQIGSSDAPGISSSINDMATDLGQLADIFAKKNLRIAYENWCWATHAPNWRDVWNIVRTANRPNLGLCLDTFQSAGGEWADPTTMSGLKEDVSKDQVQARWIQSCRDLSATIPPEKIFFLQISDAYKMDPPIQKKEDHSGLRPRGQWSHDWRPLPYHKGYLPVEDFTKAVFDTGFRGWCSIEVFDAQAPCTYGSMDAYAQRAMESLQKLLEEAGKKDGSAGAGRGIRN